MELRTITIATIIAVILVLAASMFSVVLCSPAIYSCRRNGAVSATSNGFLRGSSCRWGGVTRRYGYR